MWEKSNPTKMGDYALKNMESDTAWTKDPGFFPNYIIYYEACRELKDMKLGTLEINVSVCCVGKPSLQTHDWQIGVGENSYVASSVKIEMSEEERKFAGQTYARLLVGFVVASKDYLNGDAKGILRIERKRAKMLWKVGSKEDFAQYIELRDANLNAGKPLFEYHLGRKANPLTMSLESADNKIHIK